jgi:hypothetical protein
MLSQVKKSGNRRAGRLALVKKMGYQRENRGVALSTYNFHLFIIRFRDTTSQDISSFTHVIIKKIVINFAQNKMNKN